jgi:drug/metabolite transporter (DMT)-like permease
MAGLGFDAGLLLYQLWTAAAQDRWRTTRRPPLLQIFVTRALLLALPFLVYWGWARLARRRGRELGPTPWGWLVGTGAVLVGLSLMATVAFEGDNRNKTYVPAEAHPDGAVSPGRFEGR